ncbi:MAG: hypothetical protein AABX11_03070 [Nanoarchaeota archaeon]
MKRNYFVGEGRLRRVAEEVLGMKVNGVGSTAIENYEINTVSEGNGTMTYGLILKIDGKRVIESSWKQTYRPAGDSRLPVQDGEPKVKTTMSPIRFHHRDIGKRIFERLDREMSKRPRQRRE